MPSPPERILILGGTAEAAKLAAELVEQGEAFVITALAGRTEYPASLAGDVRIGGFGGVDGLVAYLRSEGITRVIDATHPFARQISANAVEACRKADVPLIVHLRPQWLEQPGDRWIMVETLEAATHTLPEGARVFLALGRQYIDIFARRTDCHFVIRMVDAPSTPLPFTHADIVVGKAAADWNAEKALLEGHAITHLVTRNSGGEVSYGKIIAARKLGLPVVMIARPIT
ncbi:MULTISPECIES: cobalt-precorrin-6A reductase [Rhizobium/Agrobacterium group]|uniref:cobalt-precorrin-6A reductase n=1 Tax=Rhizobium/Agrobacterium group TaxID=227290 RepID=UPI000B3FFA6B|nr:MULTISPECIES: cobalt-precorrin-6A reductase [Rhizobium/Agrobacterium group]MCF1483727.1 cobalt-precorrin-6A reductase [Allorhizobium ampelinum]NSZ43076.1 cobalt-precorrin-6A reductase [Agrobacterium vitis]NTA26733.1 cobalt-precorrin-6A reductase [Allorhizobium ampelinum]OVE94843.1 cobalt-precorrin-6A reductase [Allorhizobium ampelinum]